MLYTTFDINSLKNKPLLFLSLAYFYYIMSSPNLPSGYFWISSISYEVWIVGIVFFSLYLMPSLGNNHITDDKSWAWYVGFGIFLGLVFSIKVTFAVLPLSVLLLNFVSSKSLKTW